MKGCIALILTLLLTGCVETQTTVPQGDQLKGRWLTEPDGNIMRDPQTSGLANWRGKLLSISDGSGDESQLYELHVIEPSDASLSPQGLKIALSEKVKQGCFGQYLANKPDYEALVVDVDDDKVFYIVTEDATRTGRLTPQCKHTYRDTGSTLYPTVLVRLELQSNNSVVATHVRPLQFAEQFSVGNFPNDGIEGMAMAPDRTLYLALEKDSQKQPRIFSLKLGPEFWQTEGFAPVSEPNLKVPSFESGNHPINGMDYLVTQSGDSYLVAAARNDDQIWFIDAAGEKDTVIVPVAFFAPTEGEANCEPYELMDNFSIEGVAIDDDGIWLINDPWKRNYKKNIQCDNNANKYKYMAPLLFKLPYQSHWFEG